MKHIKKITQSGFTLVELMIVVAIIGILASIAIPNYQKYQAKARTAEAKLALSSIYTGEKSFQVEYSSYTACLNATGFGAESSDNRYYILGFNALSTNTCGTTANLNCASSMDTNAPACVTGDGVSSFIANKKAMGTAATPGVGQMPTGSQGTNTFLAGAAAQIRTDVAGSYDTWSINQNKSLLQVTIGY